MVTTACHRTACIAYFDTPNHITYLLTKIVKTFDAVWKVSVLILKKTVYMLRDCMLIN